MSWCWCAAAATALPMMADRCARAGGCCFCCALARPLGFPCTSPPFVPVRRAISRPNNHNAACALFAGGLRLVCCVVVVVGCELRLHFAGRMPPAMLLLLLFALLSGLSQTTSGVLGASATLRLPYATPKPPVVVRNCPRKMSRFARACVTRVNASASVCAFSLVCGLLGGFPVLAR